jgi:hypothetical protein
LRLNFTLSHCILSHSLTDDFSVFSDFSYS